MKTFEETKKYIVDFAIEKKACSTELNKAKNSICKKDLLQLIQDNLNWVIYNKLFNNINILEWFTIEELLSFNILSTGIDNIGLRNSGHSNSGDRNSGHSNSGDSNSGHSNSGDSNSGHSNSGDSNSGHSNSGHSNSGDSNSGHSNSGDSNSGHRNSGHSNSGHSNSGDSNSGHSNSGHWNSGAFCTNKNPLIYLFDKQTNISANEWLDSKAYKLICKLKNSFWIESSRMTEVEKIQYPSHVKTGGYLKYITLKEAWANLWNELDNDSKNVFILLPNFDSAKFEEITGIKIN